MDMENLLSFEEKPNQQEFCMQIFFLTEMIFTVLWVLPEMSVKQVHPVDKGISSGEKEQCFWENNACL